MDQNPKRPRQVDISAEERRSKNRLSAHQSRLRKRQQLKYLEEQVILLSDENKKLARANETLSLELAAARAENTQLRLMQQDSVRLATALRLAQGGAGIFNPF